MERQQVVIIGAGPAGLTAAYELSRAGTPSLILEADTQVGGLSKTLNYNKFLFDIGGHRFFTRVSVVEKMWREVLGEDLLTRPRLSRILYNGKFFWYPLRIGNVLNGLGLFESARCALSAMWARAFPRTPELDFETWVSNRFGKRLFDIFFRTYTEKVWGMRCTEISADWAAQRIQKLSFTTVLRNALTSGKKSGDGVPKSLIEQFLYPREGPGMMWSRTREIIEARDCMVKTESPVERIFWKPGCVEALESNGKIYRGEHFISSMPIRELVNRLSPAAPPEVLAAANRLRYRDYLAVCLICRGEELFPDNWVYVHDPAVKVGRIQNYGNWSAAMVPQQGKSCLGLEYFCFEGDDLWSRSDEDLVAFGAKEIEQLGLVSADRIEDGVVLRVPKAYPVYDAEYQQALHIIRGFFESLPNFQLIGRNGMHRYNNQDHSMLTGMLAARNILGGRFDLWKINADMDYHEEGEEITVAELDELEMSQPLVPHRLN